MKCKSLTLAFFFFFFSLKKTNLNGQTDSPESAAHKAPLGLASLSFPRRAQQINIQMMNLKKSFTATVPNPSVCWISKY